MPKMPYRTSTTRRTLWNNVNSALIVCLAASIGPLVCIQAYPRVLLPKLRFGYQSPQDLKYTLSIVARRASSQDTRID